MPLVLSPSIVISPSEAYDSHRPLIGYHNLVEAANIFAGSEAAEYPAINMANQSTALGWVSASTSTQYITVINLTGEIDYVGIARHNLSGATVSIEAINADTNPSFAEVHSGVVPGDDTPLLFKFERDEYTSVRVKIVPASGVEPEIAVLHIGLLLTMPIGIQPGSFSPPSEGIETDRVARWSESGEFLGAIVTGSRRISQMTFSDIPPDLYESGVAPFVEAANGGAAFFLAWSPVDDPDDVSYCWLTGSAQPVISKKTKHRDLTISVGGTNI